MATLEWDVQALRHAVRERENLVYEVLTDLMRQEADLEKSANNAALNRIQELRNSAVQIEALGGDASSVRASIAELRASYNEHSPKLAEVKRRLSIVRANMKWLDYAGEGLHWACFTDCEFQKMVEAAALSNSKRTDE